MVRDHQGLPQLCVIWYSAPSFLCPALSSQVLGFQGRPVGSTLSPVECRESVCTVVKYMSAHTLDVLGLGKYCICKCSALFCL